MTINLTTQEVQVAMQIFNSLRVFKKISTKFASVSMFFEVFYARKISLLKLQQ